MYLLDPTWMPFSSLMLKHVYNVLLICSDYDRFTLEEDGRVEEELYQEYTALGLSNPPKITHTNNEETALRLIDELSFDLVISMLDLGSERVEALAEAIKIKRPWMPVIALSPSPDHRKVKELKGENCPYIDYLFYWQGNVSLFLAMVKLVEDRMNIAHDTDVADVQVIILVEDSVRYISSFLPQMYTCLIHQNRISILEALNDWGKTLRMRGRPKIVLARTYEEAWNLYSEYKENVLGIITDVSFPALEGNEKAGLRLAEAIRAESKDVPILIQSTEKENRKDAEKLGADFLWKLSDTILQDLEAHFIKNYNFGPFIFIDPDNGKEIAVAHTMKEVQETLKTLPLPSFRYHSKRNDFSRWLRAQSLYALAAKIKNINLDAGKSDEEVRDLLYETIKAYRADRTRGVIADFSINTYDETMLFTRIGKGSLGGKGRGLAFLAMEMKASGIMDRYPSVYLSIPRTVVVSTELFMEFLELNGLSSLSFRNESDEAILALFLSAKMPEKLTRDLKAILNIIRKPISVRSSSLLEDSHFQPFAGVYQTSMIPNAGSDEKRLEDLEKAIKTVWASTYFECAKEYLKRTEHSLEEEKMAVIENFSVAAPAISRGNRKTVLFLGAINEMKGCYDIVDVIAEVKKRISDVKMIMCGDGEIKGVKGKAAKCGVLDRFEFPGWVRGEKKDQILREADLFFLPSYTEAMPMSILDAMGYGLPIIASNVGGIPRIVRDNGSMCEPGDIRGFSDKITELLENDEKRLQEGQRSREIVEKEYSLEAHIKRIEQQYREVLTK